MSNRVIGQTGSVVLSDDSIAYKKSRKRTVRYQYAKMKCGWIAWVCGPFHSRTYGVQGYGTKRSSAKAALQRRLANDYRYLGHVMFSDVDESDTVGRVDMRLLDDNAKARPVTVAEVW
jgi:hypothetical protein